MPIGARKNLGLTLGIIIFVVGLIGLLGGLGVLPFELPISVDLLAWILAGGGIYLIIESITEFGMQRGLALLVSGAALILAGIPILNTLGIVPFSIPFVSLTLYHILLTIEGVFLVINAFGT